MKLIGVIEGDGIGREVVPAALTVLGRTGLDLAGLDLAVKHFDVGAERFGRTGVAIPDEEMAELAEADAILLGAIGDPRISDPSYTAGTLGRLRNGLDLYANVRPARLLDDRLSPLRDPRRRRADIIVVRENTEGLYTNLGGRLRPGTDQEVALQEQVNTHLGVSRVIEHAFRLGRREVVIATKWNAMPHAGALWLRCWQDARARHPGLASRHLAVDACALHLVADPSAFDVIVTENCFGDILSDVAGAVVGGLGVVPSASVNAATGKALFEPVHGSAPDIAGRGIANPVATILCCAMMLRHLGFDAAAASVERAVTAAVRARECTADIGGDLSTEQAAAAIARRL